VWKRITDPEGTSGWVQETMLSDKRTVMVKDKQRILREDPKDNAAAIASADPGAIAKVQSCKGGWCAVKFDGYDGWMKEAELWGTLPNESFEPAKK
jgi:SH3-like domain-containing protein